MNVATPASLGKRIFVGLSITEGEMPRHLDLTALRSLVAVAEAGGVTRAAGRVHLTQSAVSMQLKRLEEALGQPLLDRAGRGIALTAQGEQLVAYGRRILALNDEVWARMTAQEFEGAITFGAPYDVIYPHIPGVLQRFAAEYPRVKVQLASLFTAELKDLFARGEVDLILTTEEGCDRGGERLARQPIVWVGAEGGQAWRSRPLRFASTSRCLFKRPALDRLEAAGVPWELAVDSVATLPVEASVAADLAVSVNLESAVPKGCEVVRHCGALPALPIYRINLYRKPGEALVERLADFLRAAYAERARAPAAAE
jgi:DNA-binding transcriptional LysR family regulator